MPESVAKLWRSQSRNNQIIANVILLLLISFVGLYYFSWSDLQLSTYSNSSENTVSVQLPGSDELVDTHLVASVYDPKKVAFLVETRPLPHLPALYTHMTAITPPEWTFKFMGSKESIAHMRSSPNIRRMEEDRKVAFILLPDIYTVTDRESISQMFTDPHLYRDILAPAEHLLVFQPDSVFCANCPKTLNDFLEWDWIGAPWLPDAQYGGNGGLSLRKVSSILAVLENNRRPVGDPALEDLWLASQLRSLPGTKLPDATISKGFSVESVWDDQPLGYHVGWMGVHHEQIWDTEEQLNHIFKYCPEVKMILGMKLANDKPVGVD